MKQISIALALVIALCAGCGVSFRDYRAEPESPMSAPSESEIACWKTYEQAQRYIRKGDWLKGEELCWQALKALQRTDPDHARGAMLNNLVRPLIMNGKPDEALRVATEALGMNQKTHDNVGIACSFCNIGDAYEALGQKDKRNEFWSKAAEPANETRNPEIQRFVQRRMKIIAKDTVGGE